MVRSHGDKAPVTIDGRQVGPVLAPRARSSMRFSSFPTSLARECAQHVHRRETTEAEEPATRFIMIASRRIYRLPDTPGKNGTAFTALHSLEERSLSIRRAVIFRCADAT